MTRTTTTIALGPLRLVQVVEEVPEPEPTQPPPIETTAVELPLRVAKCRTTVAGLRLVAGGRR